jgi:molecular chaperone DnaJ
LATHPCEACGGTGREKTRRRITLRIPKGVETGSRLRLAGKGEGGVQGGDAGDLYVVIHVRKHELFQRDGDDLFCEVPVSFDAAALGHEVQVPTIDGLAKLKLSAGTENGKVFRLRGKGMPTVDGYGRGDLHVRVVSEVPHKINSRQKKLLEELGETWTPVNFPGQREYETRVQTFYERKGALTKG